MVLAKFCSPSALPLSRASSFSPLRALPHAERCNLHPSLWLSEICAHPFAEDPDICQLHCRARTRVELCFPLLGPGSACNGIVTKSLTPIKRGRLIRRRSHATALVRTSPDPALLLHLPVYFHFPAPAASESLATAAIGKEKAITPPSSCALGHTADCCEALCRPAKCLQKTTQTFPQEPPYFMVSKTNLTHKPPRIPGLPPLKLRFPIADGFLLEDVTVPPRG